MSDQLLFSRKWVYLSSLMYVKNCFKHSRHHIAIKFEITLISIKNPCPIRF